MAGVRGWKGFVFHLCSSKGMTMGYTDKTVLLVEDHVSDARLMELALKKNAVGVHLQVVTTGEKALKFLKKAAPFESAATPDLILLDLNMPGIGGKEVLAHVKSDALLKHIPVIILSSSVYAKDVEDCYSLYANCYLKKPSSLDELYSLVGTIIQFWMGHAQIA